jgi:hypothetical protein
MNALKLMNAVLILIVAGLVVYIMWPSINLAMRGKPLGSTVSGINDPLSPAQLIIINNAPDSYFEKAGRGDAEPLDTRRGNVQRSLLCARL